MSRTIVHRLLSTLENAGYIQRNAPSPGYRLGTKSRGLGYAAIHELEISDVARPYLEALALRTKELVNITILEGAEVVYIEKIDCSLSVRAHIPKGGRAPAYCVATGKAMLAQLKEQELIRVLSGGKQSGKTPIKSMTRFKEELARIRKRGYSVNIGGYREDVGGVATAICDSKGNPVAAVGITFPLNRRTNKNMIEFGRLTKETAAAISKELGYEERQVSAPVATANKIAAGEKR